MADSVPVGPGTKVTLRFSLSIKEGELIDSTGDRSATFVVGDGNLMPGFESAMFGMRRGDSALLDIEADHGFGQPNPDNVHMMPQRLFKDVALEPGLVVSFADGEANERPGVVSRLLGDMVEIDFNHPLAGQDLSFEVEILDVEQVSDEILRM
ncbi:MAG: peptidylprolyl isomerase [Pseudomonadales bacterium]|nr:peptidylprolyl isomerase [Pseudomonadales bacterium]MBO6564068.1 peptidylprolyl isomerase [Pseudomonadales bacterium]MBO6597990.1 peptidylprolyl isomerase [Pseudomonadales bacterium]MBO6822988.1 peptidylprolyl isomerase [Pseudomonadales bacterium]